MTKIIFYIIKIVPEYETSLTIFSGEKLYDISKIWFASKLFLLGL